MTEPTARELCADAAKQDICIPYFEMLASRVEKVLALHRPGALGNACRHCVCTWPCPTIRILNGEQP